MAEDRVISTRRDVPNNAAPVRLDLYVGGNYASSVYRNLVTALQTRDSYGSEYSVDGQWPYVKDQLLHHDSRLTPQLRHVYKTFDWGNPYYLDRVKLKDFSHRGVTFTRKPGSGNGYAGTSQIFPSLSTLITNWPSSLKATLLSKTDQENLLLSRGAHVISSTLPEQPTANLIPALVELLQDGLPRLGDLRPRTVAPREIASSFLAWEFGFKPLISDIRDTLKAVSQSRKILKEFSRRFEKTYRRGYVFPTQRVHESGIYSFASDHMYPWDYPYNWQQRSARYDGYSITECRFAGEYLYHQIVAGELWENIDTWADEADRLLGLDPRRLIHIWEALPWTWLVDWIANIGDVIRNVSYVGNDGLVMRYGYLTIDQTITVNYRGPVMNSWSSDRSLLCYTVEQRRKMRVRASPYGFGLNPTGFTNKQWAILASIGLTRFGRNT